jgi:DNA-binding CsgD family transcriptional regulator
MTMGRTACACYLPWPTMVRRARVKGPSKQLEALRALALVVDRRPKQRETPGESDAAVWTALVHGRARVVQRFKRRGRSYLLLRMFRASSHARSLDEREVFVLSRRVQGASLKSIGTDLGIGVSTVAYAIRRAMHKLGVSTQVELVTLFSLSQCGVGSDVPALKK